MDWLMAAYKFLKTFKTNIHNTIPDVYDYVQSEGEKFLKRHFNQYFPFHQKYVTQKNKYAGEKLFNFLCLYVIFR